MTVQSKSIYIATYTIEGMADKKISALNVERLPAKVRDYAQTLPHQRAQFFLVSRILLAELLYRRDGLLYLPEIIYSSKHRPIFADPCHGDFNISHSGNQIAVALSTESIGIDLEVIRLRRNLDKLIAYSFSQVEREWIYALSPTLPTFERERIIMQRFWQLWTAREAIVKLTGDGVWSMKHIDVDLCHQRFYVNGTPIYLASYQFDTFYLSLSQYLPFPQLVLFNDGGEPRLVSSTHPINTPLLKEGIWL